MDTRRLILLMVFGFSLFMLWEKWQAYVNPKPVAAPTATAPAGPGALPQPTALPGAAVVPGVSTANATPLPAGAQPVVVTTDLFKATLTPLGGDIVQLELLKHREHGDKSKNLVLFDPAHQYLAQTGLLGDGMPNHRTQFALAAGPTELAEGAAELKLRLSAPVQDGLTISKVYTFKRGSYLIDIAWEIDNRGQKTVTPFAYYQLQRDDVAPQGESRMVSTFTGPAVFTDADKYQKVDFGDIVKGKAKFAQKADNGWMAMVQHYFVAAWVPKDKTLREYYMRKADTVNGANLVQAGVIVPMPAIAPGGKTELSVGLYAGPQEQAALKQVATGLDLVVDYGWLTVIAAPIFWALEWIHAMVGNWGWAIVVLTIIIKLLFFPLSAASYKSMAKMRTLTPKMMTLKERYGDDKQKLNQEMMKLYQTEKVNPLGGCLPILVQIPVFIALYWVLLGAVEMRDAPWILWINDLSTADPYYVLPIIMILSMVVQSKLNPEPPDPIQAKMMKIMPFAFGVMFLFFPAGLVLYWVVNNVLSIAQQWQITRMIEAGGKAANDAKA